MIQIQARRTRRWNLREKILHGWRCQVRFVEVFAAAVDFEGEHAGCGRKVVCVVDGDAKVVCFCGGFGSGDVFCEEVVGGLPLWGKILVGGKGEGGEG